MNDYKRNAVNAGSIVVVLIAFACFYFDSALANGGCASHPCLIMTPADVDILKKNIQGVDWMNKYFQEMKSYNDGFRSRGLNVPALGGGYTQNYICPIHGKYLQYDPNQPHRHFCAQCNKYYESSTLDSCWREITHNQNIESARDAGLIYIITGETKYAEWARTVLIHYAENYSKYPPHGGPAGLGRITSQSLDEAVWLVNAAAAYDLIADAQCMSDEDRNEIEKKLFLPAARHIRNYPFGIHNIQVWESVAMLMAGILADSHIFTMNAMNTLRDEIVKGITSEGLWYETSVGYHLYAMKPFSMLAVICRNRGLDLCDNPKFKRYFTVLPEIALPDISLPAINDYRHSVRLTEMMAGAVAARYAFGDTSLDPLIGALGGELKWEPPERGAFIYYRSPEVELKPFAWKPPKGSRHLPGSGITVLRRDGLYALIKYNPFSGGHDHADRLEVIFHTGGSELFTDLGTVPYGHPLYRSWYRKTEAHNTIMVDGKQQNRAACTPLHFYDEPDFAGVTVECNEIYEGVSIRRTLVLAGGALIDVTTAKSAAPHTYDWFLHVNSVNDQNWKILNDSPVDAMSPNPEIVLKERIGVENQYTIVFSAPDLSAPTNNTAFYTIKPSVLYKGFATGFFPDEKMPLAMWRQKGLDAAFIAVTRDGAYNTPKVNITDRQLVINIEGNKKLAISFGDSTITSP